MIDHPENIPDNADEPIEEPSKPAPMGRNFYVVMALIAFLVFLILFINIPGMKSSAATTLVQNNWTCTVVFRYIRQPGSRPERVNNHCKI